MPARRYALPAASSWSAKVAHSAIVGKFAHATLLRLLPRILASAMAWSRSPSMPTWVDVARMWRRSRSLRNSAALRP
jgi:hypothetical protein